MEPSKPSPHDAKTSLRVQVGMQEHSEREALPALVPVTVSPRADMVLTAMGSDTPGLSAQDQRRLGEPPQSEARSTAPRRRHNREGPAVSPQALATGLSSSFPQSQDGLGQSRSFRRVASPASGIFRMTSVIEDEPQLDKDFLERPWVKPSIQVAMQYKRERVFREGVAPLQQVDVSIDPELGPGIRLYFTFLKFTAVCLAVMSVLSIPSIIFSYYGQAISITSRDILGLYKFTLGNIGFDKLSATYADDAGCPGDSAAICIPLGPFKLSLAAAGYILAIFEVFQTLVFATYAYLLYLEYDYYDHEQLRFQRASVTSFSVTVRNLPKAFTTLELIQHFSRLYALDSVDWRGRPTVTNALPVQNIQHSDNPVFFGSWVADCYLNEHLQTSSLSSSESAGGLNVIALFKAHEPLIEKLHHYRAQMQMYTTLKIGDRFSYAESRLKSVEQSLMRILDQNNLDGSFIRKMSRLVNPKMGRNGNGDVTRVLPFSRSVSSESVSDRQSYGNGRSWYDGFSLGSSPLAPNNAHSITSGASSSTPLRAPPERHISYAFLTFEHSESMARCLEDYNTYNAYYRYYNYPAPLLFKGQRLLVTQASEPDEIIWEHLDVNRTRKSCSRFASLVVTALFMVACFLVILQFVVAGRGSDSALDLSLCTIEIPLLVLLASSEVGLTTNMLQPTLPPVYKQDHLDKQCQTLFRDDGGSHVFYGVFAQSGNFSKAVLGARSKYTVNMNADISVNLTLACSVGGLCPHPGSGLVCPCYTTSSSLPTTTPCSTANCYSGGSNCVKFNAATIGDCFCLSILSDLVSRLGITRTVSTILSATATAGLLATSSAFTNPAGTSATNSDKNSSPLGSFNGCRTFLLDYVNQQTNKYIAIASTAVLNVILERSVSSYLVGYEYHTSVTDRNSSIMIKLFIVIVFNLVLVILLASGYIANEPVVLVTLKIFQGDFGDFSPAWFGVVGTWLILVVSSDVALDLGTKFLWLYLVMPAKRAWVYYQLRNSYSHHVVRQRELNQYEVGPVFDETLDFAHALAWLFFAMVYAAGLPISLPIMAVSFALYYHVNKLYLCRYNERPPVVGRGLMEIALRVLPWMVVFRLAFACWMFSNIFATGKLTKTVLTTASDAALGSAITQRLSPGYIIVVLVLLGTATLALLVIGGLRRVAALIPKWPFRCWGKQVVPIAGDSSIGHHTSKAVLHKLKHPLRRESASFTGSYFKFVDESFLRSANHQLEADESIRGGNSDSNSNKSIRGLVMCLKSVPMLRRRSLFQALRLDIVLEQGWIVTMVEGTHAIVKRLDNIAADVVDGEGDAHRGDEESDESFKRTYEVIAESGCNSYAIESIPQYQIAVEAIHSLLQKSL